MSASDVNENKKHVDHWARIRFSKLGEDDLDSLLFRI